MSEPLLDDSIAAYLASQPPYSMMARTRTRPKNHSAVLVLQSHPTAVTTSDELLRCSRCKCLYFCSTKCQREYWPQHKAACNKIHKLEKSVKKEAEKLESTIDHHFVVGRDAVPENLFETSVGHFWVIMATRDYMRARMHLAEEIYFLAYDAETVELWNMALYHYQELLRLSSLDNLGVRFKFPFLLLYLNRDDDAYSFCRYWLNCENEDYEEREARHENSNEGDWLYPRQEGCRYLDIFEECPNQDPKYMDLAFLVTICIIKLRIVAANDAKTQRGIQVTEDETEKTESNRRQVHCLLDQIHENNPSMLPSIINPMPLKSQPLPDYRVPGRPSEAYTVLNNANRCWVRVPGAEEMLVERFGSRHPTYDSNLSVF